ncbi:MAG: polysaccharide biosynthesis tyrosine autokinase [Candidatus Omnitrophica bacterium]|nr:polysaccharide biosynthesis tyrosine autokinase [Candidatus Omnitrophota bacterium]
MAPHNDKGVIRPKKEEVNDFFVEDLIKEDACAQQTFFQQKTSKEPARLKDRIQPEKDLVWEGEGVNLRDITEVLFRRKGFIAFFFLATVLLFILGTMLVTPVYEASTLIAIESPEKFIISPDFPPSERGDWVETEARILKSLPVLSQTVDLLRLDTREMTDTSHRSGGAFIMDWYRTFDRGSLTDEQYAQKLRERAIRSLEKNVEVSSPRFTTLIRVNAYADGPQLAADIANTITQVYVTKHFQGQKGQLQKNYDFVTEQKEMARVELEQAEQALQEFLKTENVASLEEELKINTEKLVAVQSDYWTTRRRKEEIQTALDDPAIDLDKIIAAIPEIRSDPYIDGLKEQLALLETQLSQFLSKYTPSGELVTKLKQDIGTLKRSIQDESLRVVDTTLAFLDAREDSLSGEVTRYEEKIQNISQKELALQRRRYDVAHKRDIYTMLSKKEDELRISDAMESDQISSTKHIRLVQDAQPPFSPIRPKWMLNIALALLIGTAGGICGAFFIDYWDDTIKDGRAVTRYIKADVLANIPYFTWRQRRELRANGYIMHDSFKEMWINLHAALRNKASGSLVLTSLYREGKTTTATGLAFTAARLNPARRILLVDAHMRMPGLCKRLKLECGTPGLAEIIGEEATLETCLQNTQLDNLKVLPAGSLHSEEPLTLFESARFDELLDLLHLRFDLILFDSPSLSTYPDGRLLSGKTDGTILLIEAMKTRRAVLRYYRSLLEKSGATLIGCVVNKRRFFIPGWLYNMLCGEQA